jgi:hypothetical protein
LQHLNQTGGTSLPHNVLYASRRSKRSDRPWIAEEEEASTSNDSSRLTEDGRQIAELRSLLEQQQQRDRHPEPKITL